MGSRADPATAQFMIRDPLAAWTRTPYGYAKGNPLLYSDPSGLACSVGTGRAGPVQYPVLPNPADCVKDAIEGAPKAAADTGKAVVDHASLAIAPLVFLFCVYEPEACTKVAVVGAVGTAATDGAREFLDPCLDLQSALLQDLLVTLAAALPGGLFEATAGRYGPELGPVARRAIQGLLDAPGLGAEEVHAVRGR